MSILIGFTVAAGAFVFGFLIGSWLQGGKICELEEEYYEVLEERDEAVAAHEALADKHNTLLARQQTRDELGRFVSAA